MGNNKHRNGFTLIELMIVVVIIGVLAAVAIPSYQDSVKKSHRADAAGALLVLANKMERHFTVNNQYGSIVVAGDSTDHYTMSASISATSYTLSATPIASDTCGVLTLTHTGVKAASTGSVAECWK